MSQVRAVTYVSGPYNAWMVAEEGSEPPKPAKSLLKIHKNGTFPRMDPCMRVLRSGLRVKDFIAAPGPGHATSSMKSASSSFRL